jgi:hypothetical protein
MQPAAGLLCPRCNRSLQPRHAFCTNCGASVSSITGAARPERAPFPLRFDVEYPARLSRLLIFVKLIIAIPQLIVVYFLNTLAGVVTFICWFSILFTRSYPRGLFQLVVSFNRWNANVYAYIALMRDEYPPFSGEPGRYPLAYEVERPERLSRWLIFVKWFLSIPHQIALYFLAVVALLLVYPLAWLSILLLGRYPRPFFRFMRGLMRWYWRVNAYSSLLRDEFPPYSMAAQSRQGPVSKILISFGVLVIASTTLVATIGALALDPRTETLSVSYEDVLAGRRTETVSVEGTEAALLGADDPYTAGSPPRGTRYIAFTLSIRNRDSLFTSIDETAFRLRGANDGVYDPEYAILPDAFERDAVLGTGDSARVTVVFAVATFEEPASLTYAPGLASFLPIGEKVRFEFR